MLRTIRMKDLEALIKRAQTGDLDAFGAIVQQFQDMAVGYAYSILGNFELAEDVAQEAFIQVYRDLSTLREPKAFPAWFRKIIFKFCNRFIRGKHIPLVSLDYAGEVPTNKPDSMKSAEHHQMQDKVLNAIKSLPENERMVTTLFYINGYSIAEVGAFLELPVSTVKNRLYSARKKLRERMEDMVEKILKKHAPGEDFGKRVERILAGITPISYRINECTFCGCVVSALKYLKEETNHSFIMGITGGAFKLFWHPRWCPSNGHYYVLGEKEITKMMRRTFGYYGYKVAFTGFDCKDKSNWKGIVKKSIDSGYPVISQGIIGPPECSLITGYKGDKVIGLSYFHETGKHFEVENWENNCQSLLYITGRCKKEDNKKGFIHKTLKFAVELAKVQERAGRISGLKAYDVWAEELLNDKNFKDESDENVKRRNNVNKSVTLSNLLYSRKMAIEYLCQISDFFETNYAKKYYSKVVDLLVKGMTAVPFCFDEMEVQKTILNKNNRRQLAEILKNAKIEEEKAVKELEKITT